MEVIASSQIWGILELEYEVEYFCFLKRFVRQFILLKKKTCCCDDAVIMNNAKHRISGKLNFQNFLKFPNFIFFVSAHLKWSLNGNFRPIRLCVQL